MLGAYIGATLLGGGVAVLGGGAGRRACGRRARDRGGAAAAAAARRQRAGAGAGDARDRVHHRRSAASGAWGGDPMTLPIPRPLRPPLRFCRVHLPDLAAGRAGRRAGRRGAAVAAAGPDPARRDDPRRGGRPARWRAGCGIPVSRLFTAVFFLGAALAGIGGVLGGPILTAYPGLDTDMLPLALVVVILGGVGSLPGALVGSLLVGSDLQFRHRAVPGLRLCRAVPADGGGAGVQAGRACSGG